MLIALAALMPLPVRAEPTSTLMDRRVTAISKQALLTEPAIKLVDPGRQRAADELTTINRPLFFAWALFQILAFLYLWRSGNAARVRDWLRRRIRSETALRIVYGFLLAIVAQLCAFPVSFTRFRLAYAAELTSQSVASWLRDWAVAAAIDALIAGIFIGIILLLVDRTRLWYAVAIILVFVGTLGIVFLEPVVLAPLFNTYAPLSQPSLEARIHDLTERAGIGSPPVYVDDLSRQWAVGNAWVAGFGATKRIVVGDTLVTTETPDEVSFIVAHELGHYVRHDVLSETLVATALFVVTMAIAVLIGDRVGFRRDDDPVSRLPLVGAILGCAALALFPVFNAYSRGIEARADRFALALTHDPASGVRAFVRFADDGLSPVCPPQIVRLYFYDHPPLGSRIAALQGRPDPCP